MFECNICENFHHQELGHQSYGVIEWKMSSTEANEKSLKLKCPIVI